MTIDKIGKSLYAYLIASCGGNLHDIDLEWALQMLAEKALELDGASDDYRVEVQLNVSATQE